MGVFENFPYANFHELNLDWIIKALKQGVEYMETVKEKVDALDINSSNSALNNLAPYYVVNDENYDTENGPGIEENVWKEISNDTTIPEDGIYVVTCAVSYMMDSGEESTSRADISTILRAHRNDAGIGPLLREVTPVYVRLNGGSNLTSILNLKAGDKIVVSAIQIADVSGSDYRIWCSQCKTRAFRLAKTASNS